MSMTATARRRPSSAIGPMAGLPIGGQGRKTGQPDTCHGQPHGGAPDGDEQALGQELAPESSSSGSKRHAEPDLPTPPESAREQQPADVGAGDEPDERGRGLQGDERHSRPAEERLADRAQPHLRAALRLREGTVYLQADPVQVRPRVLRGHARCNPRHHAQKAGAVTVGLGSAGGSQSRTQSCWNRNASGDADDGPQPADARRGTNGGWTGAEPTPPEALADTTAGTD
jgi:hypothetical protein